MLNAGHKNGDGIEVHTEAPDSSSDQSSNCEPREIGFADSRLESRLMSECNDAWQLIDVEGFQKSTGDVNASGSINFALILKKVPCYVNRQPLLFLDKINLSYNLLVL